MTLEQAIKVLKTEYAHAKAMACVKDPVAYALYYTWKAADREREKDGDKSGKM